MYRKKTELSQAQIAVTTLLSVALVVFTGDVVAGTTMTIGGVATTITASFAKLTQLITATSYLAGMGFAVGAIIKFKAHKDNPAQVPIGQPVGLLMVAAALLFLPTILGVAGMSIFGLASTASGPTGVSSF